MALYVPKDRPGYMLEDLEGAVAYMREQGVVVAVKESPEVTQVTCRAPSVSEQDLERVLYILAHSRIHPAAWDVGVAVLNEALGKARREQTSNTPPGG